MSDAAPKRILIVDDDPTHLDIYGMIVEQAGLRPVKALVRFAGMEPLKDRNIAAILLDYRLTSIKTASEIARELIAQLPQAPILVLSDLWSLPQDIEPYASGFLRKGDPKTLVNTLHKILTAPDTAATATTEH